MEPYDEACEEAHGGAHGGSRGGGGADLEKVVAGLAAIDGRLCDLDERARHREAVIDRLHTENQELRSGERRAVLDPVVTDLVRLHEQLTHEAAGLREREQVEEQEWERDRAPGRDPDRDPDRTAALLESLADDVLLALERVGVEPVEARVGDPFRADLHQPLSTVEDPDSARANTVARVVAQGFRDAATGRIRRRVRAHFFRHVEPVQP